MLSEIRLDEFYLNNNYDTIMNFQYADAKVCIEQSVSQNELILLTWINFNLSLNE